jgi:hypothetical protein
VAEIDAFLTARHTRRLVVGPLTVRNHLTNILAKLGVTDRQAAAEVARRSGIATPSPPAITRLMCQRPSQMQCRSPSSAGNGCR